MQPNNRAITLVVPLADFAKAYEAADRSIGVEAQQKKLQDELQRRAEEAQEAQAQPPPKQ